LPYPEALSTHTYPAIPLCLLLLAVQDLKAQDEDEIAALGYGCLFDSSMGQQFQQEAASFKRLEAAILEQYIEVSM
jgi:hypothetical protein